MWEEAVSSNINEVIRAVLNPLFFFYKTILHAPKAQNHKNATKQKHKNANKRTKIKNVLKKGEKAYLRFCAFCALEEKKIEKRKKSPQC